MVRLAPDAATKVAIILTWLCGGRVGDVLKAVQREVKLDHQFNRNGKLKVFFARGKAAQLGSDPYHVPTVCPAPWRPILRQYLEQFGPREELFPGGPKRFGSLVNLAVRTVTPNHSVRALRRGALQTMARNGVPLETLMFFSGHKSVDTCKRYLGWGEHAGEMAAQAQDAARHLQVVA